MKLLISSHSSNMPYSFPSHVLVEGEGGMQFQYGNTLAAPSVWTHIAIFLQPRGPFIFLMTVFVNRRAVKSSVHDIILNENRPEHC